MLRNKTDLERLQDQVNALASEVSRLNDRVDKLELGPWVNSSAVERLQSDVAKLGAHAPMCVLCDHEYRLYDCDSDTGRFKTVAEGGREFCDKCRTCRNG